jgi:hypothetical protein
VPIGKNRPQKEKGPGQNGLIRPTKARRASSLKSTRGSRGQLQMSNGSGLMVVQRKIHSRAGPLCRILMAAESTAHIITQRL